MRDAVLSRPTNGRDSRERRLGSNQQSATTVASSNALTVTPGRDARKLAGHNRTSTVDDPGVSIEHLTIPQAPKMIVFGAMPHLQPTRASAFSETADRSERLRRYNLNDTFATSMLLTSIRDIPLEAPPPTEKVPAWKTIRPRTAKMLPHAEPIGERNMRVRRTTKNSIFSPAVSPESKPARWIEIASPYINYPMASALNM